MLLFFGDKLCVAAATAAAAAKYGKCDAIAGDVHGLTTDLKSADDLDDFRLGCGDGDGDDAEESS